MAQPGELFLMARVPEAIGQALLRPIVDNGLDTTLGDRLSSMRNSHQTLSSWYPREKREAILQACAGLVAHAFTLRLDRLQSVKGRPPKILWMYVPGLGKSDGLTELLAALRIRLRQQNLPVIQSFGAHVTMSYDARHMIDPIDIPPVFWLIDTIELVEAAGYGKDYRYEVVESFSLLPPAAPPPMQLGLLG